MPLDDMHIRAATQPNSYDPETRTVSAVIATANPVQRRDARGPFSEILTAGTLDLSAVEGLAPTTCCSSPKQWIDEPRGRCYQGHIDHFSSPPQFG